MANKKTFLLIHAYAVATETQRLTLQHLMDNNHADKVQEVLAIYQQCGVGDWAKSLQDNYVATSFQHLEEIAVLSIRKKPLQDLATVLVQREM